MAANYVKQMMKLNRLSRNETARRFGVKNSILDRLISKTITYVPIDVKLAMARAKDRSHRAYYKMPDPKQKTFDETVVRQRLQDNERERHWLEDLLRGNNEHKE